jgi:hypothetical protein
MISTKSIISFGALILCVALGIYLFKLSLVDDCLDVGGVFDWNALTCRMDVMSLPVPSGWMRHRTEILIGTTGVILVIATITFKFSKQSDH